MFSHAKYTIECGLQRSQSRLVLVVLAICAWADLDDVSKEEVQERFERLQRDLTIQQQEDLEVLLASYDAEFQQLERSKLEAQCVLGGGVAGRSRENEETLAAGTHILSSDPAFQFVSYRKVLDLPKPIWGTVIEDCRIVSENREDSQYWLGALDMEKPQHGLESLAASIFEFYAEGVDYDPANSGAEWWVHTYVSNKEDDMFANGIPFHWDKDELLLRSKDELVHPNVSTVTYMSNEGAPTVLFGNIGDLWINATHVNVRLPETGESSDTYISHPIRGKHIAFRGHMLHGAPEFLTWPFRRGASATNAVYRFERVTFLVNVWFDHRPGGIQRFPTSFGEEMRAPINLTARFASANRVFAEPIDLSDDSDQAPFDSFAAPVEMDLDDREPLEKELTLIVSSLEGRAGRSSRCGGGLGIYDSSAHSMVYSHLAGDEGSPDLKDQEPKDEESLLQ